MLGRFARSGAVALIAAGLVFAVPLAAEAYVVPAPVGEFVLGSVRAAAPLEEAASVIGPEGTLIVSSLVALGALAYATRDTWMPWVAGAFGAGGTTTTATPGNWLGQGMFWGLSVGGSTATITLTLVTGTEGSTDDSVTYSCRGPSGESTGSIPWSSAPGGYFGTTGQVKSSTVNCAAGWSISGVQTAHTGNYAAGNSLLWGLPFDPQTGATYRVDNTCLKPDGSSATISATTVNPGSGGLLVPSCALAFGPDTHSTGWIVNGAPNGGTQHELSRTTIPQTSVAYPNCVGAGVACTYVVEYNGVACVVGQTECMDWSRRNALGIGGEYTCRFGAYPIALSACAVDERVYELGGVPLTSLNTDGNPWTYETPGPSWAPTPDPSPSPAPTGAPGGDPVPMPPGVDPSPIPPLSGEPNTNNCWASGFAAWNPADWVLTPVKCALQWAFVPSTASVGTLAATASTDLTRVGVAPMANAVSDNFGKLGAGSGCDGPAVTFAAVGVVKPLHPFSACSQPMATLAGISYAMTTIAVVLGGGWVLLRALGEGFGFHMGSLGRGGGASV